MQDMEEHYDSEKQYADWRNAKQDAAERLKQSINTDTPKGRMFEYLINNINSTLAILRDSYGACVKDEQDFEYYLHEIRYSPAQDEVMTVFKGTTHE